MIWGFLCRCDWCHQVFFNNLWDRFEEIDKDRDRHLNIEEFAAGAALVGVPLCAEDVEFEFRQCDASGDGTIVRMPHTCFVAFRIPAVVVAGVWS